jgi:hypothetical protein
MENEEKVLLDRRLLEALEEKEILNRIEEMVARRKAVNAREIAACQTLLKTHPAPDLNAPPLSQLESLAKNLFGALVGGVEQDAAARGSSHQPSDEDRGDGVFSDRVSEEEVAPYWDCGSLEEIADRCAELHDGVVYVASVTDIAEAKGFANREHKNPHKQLWLRVYNLLGKSELYEYSGRHTGKFTRLSPLA